MVRVISVGKAEEFGTAFFVAPRIAVTCKHVVRLGPIRDLRLVAWAGEHVRVLEICEHPDENVDIAALKVDEADESGACLALSPSQLAIGEEVDLHGYSSRYGKIEERTHTVATFDSERRMYCLQHLAAAGFSGSPVISEDMVIGVAKALAVNRQLTYIIPIAFARDVLKNIDSPHGNAASNEVARNVKRMDQRQLRPGLSSALGSIHVHIDGGGDEQLARRTARTIDARWQSSEIALVRASAPGPQRLQKPELYRLHTPEKHGKECVDYFSTTLLHQGPENPDKAKLAEIEEKVRTILGRLHSPMPGETSPGDGEVVVEAERVVGIVDSTGEPRWAPGPPLSKAFGPNFAFRKARVAESLHNAYEIHFAVDILGYDGDTPPVALDTLTKLCDLAGISVGGWFLFDKAGAWAYRSNMFLEEVVTSEQARQYHVELLAQLVRIPELKNAKVSVRVLVEESLGVWRTRFHKEDDKVLTVPELAAWEADQPNGSSFWVVTGDFLGDHDLLVEDAMVRNLGRRVHYSYFLQSFADLKRWVRFRRRLEEDHFEEGALYPLMTAYVLEFTDAEIWSKKLDCFIANAGHGTKRSGYRLSRVKSTRRIVSGKEMTGEEVAEVCDLLSHVVTNHSLISTVRLTTPFPDRGVLGALIWLDFGKLKTMTPGNPIAHEHINGHLEIYDSEVAAEVSRERGVVVRSSERGLAVMLPRHQADRASDLIKSALRLANEMRQRLDRMAREAKFRLPSYRIVIGYGLLRRTLRSHGFHVSGDVVTACRAQAAALRSRCCIVLPDVAKILRGNMPEGINITQLPKSALGAPGFIVTWEG